MIPKKDKRIVKALLIKSYFPVQKEDKDHIFVDWFNNSIDETDFDRIINLGYRVEFLIDDEIYYDDWDLDEVTKDEWKLAINSSINLSRALSVKRFAYEMIQLYDSSNVLKATPHKDRLMALHVIYCARRKCPWGTYFPSSCTEIS